MSHPDVGRLVDLVRRLRGPGGCPWDQEQSLQDLRAYLLEEAHELAAAIDGGTREELAEELGDLLFQVVFVAELAAEGEDTTALGDAIDRVHDKMVSRHPHVFGGERLPDRQAVNAAWERRKLEQASDRRLLEGVPESLPALLGAYRMTQKAAGVGFDWPEPAAILDDIEEEIGELREALAGGDEEAVRDELGDLLFTVANLARRLDLDPEAALAGTNRKFRRRLGYVEERLREQGRRISETDLETLDILWDAAKAEGL